jgi:hypothetical protein
MGNIELNMLVTGFNQLLHDPQHSLEIIRENMRQHFANISDVLFHFGSYTSVHNIMLTILRSNIPITKTTRQCTNPNHTMYHESEVKNAMIKVSSTAAPTQSLQHIMNHFQEPLPSRCHTCNQQQVRHTKLLSQPPLLAFEWDVNAPPLNNTLHIAAGPIYHTYHLCGIIYLSHEHFTSHFVDREGQKWFHDGIVTGATLRKEATTVCQYPQAILAVYCY